MLHYSLHEDDCEVVVIVSLAAGRGVGSSLMDAARSAAATEGCRRLWLVTTKDNTPALRFYQRWGMDLVALHHDALDASRRLKPEIPATGLDGIPIRHELELELRLRPGPGRVGR